MEQLTNPKNVRQIRKVKRLLEQAYKEAQSLPLLIVERVGASTNGLCQNLWTGIRLMDECEKISKQLTER